TLVIVAYNLLGSVFRGIGDSKTPLKAVAIACLVNIVGDLFFVSVCHLGAAGAAVATVLAQAVSVVVSLIFISRRSLPFSFSWKQVRPEGRICLRITKLGLPLAISDLLVGISFVVIQAIVNSLGLIPSAGIGVAEKVCAFIMLVPSSFMQSMAAFTAQNVGAGKKERALRALLYGTGLSLAAGAVMFYLAFFHGDLLCGIFSKDALVMAAGWDYLKAYAIDCLLTAIFFVFIGFYNGLGLTKFVMAQGIISAFGVRVPVSFYMSRLRPVSLFAIGLATPLSSALQICMCLVCLWYIKKKGIV
ncbi:MAG: polysaccharide biosynthesis C-terminal domain-containing protein, partial [Blautia sp.]|nr:polysaccharide biosynthesis C-terminal domain-containing protein [Blautia sp.]